VSITGRSSMRTAAAIIGSSHVGGVVVYGLVSYYHQPS
jgi:hypothetical protein